jgi:hypothetical protein
LEPSAREIDRILTGHRAMFQDMRPSDNVTG